MTIGIDLGAVGVNAAVVENGVIYQRITEVLPSERSDEEYVVFLISVVKKLFNTNIRGIGVSVPTIVDSVEGVVYNSLSGQKDWTPIPLRRILEKEFRIPVCINNDSNCLAFAERYYGEATPFRNIVAVKMGTGLGAGVMINDVLYNGWNTGAGEIGHIPYRDKSYEAYCASDFFKKYNTSAYITFIGAEKGEKEALSIWKEFGYHVGNLMKTILFTFDPQVIILGGDISRAYPYFSKAMFDQLSTFPYAQTLRRIKILPSKNDDIALLGAAALIP